MYIIQLVTTLVWTKREINGHSEGDDEDDTRGYSWIIGCGKTCNGLATCPECALLFRSLIGSSIPRTPNGTTTGSGLEGWTPEGSIKMKKKKRSLREFFIMILRKVESSSSRKCKVSS